MSILGYTGERHGQPILTGPQCWEGNGLKVVLDGNVENRGLLRVRLIAEGARFDSQSDAEVVARLLARRHRAGLLEAVYATLADLRGQFAFVAMSADQPGLLVGTCHGASLVVGGAPGNQFVASAPGPFGIRSDRVRVVADDEVVALTPRRPTEFDAQPHWLARTLLTHLDPAQALPDEVLAGTERVRILASGGSLHAGFAGRAFIEEWAGVPVDVEDAAEERYRAALVRPPGELVVGILRPGATADTLAAMRAVRRNGATVVALATAPDRRMLREADHVLLTAAGLEAGVGESRTYLCEAAVLGALALQLGHARGVPLHVLDKLERRLRDLPDVIEATLAAVREPVRALAERLSGMDEILFVGRGAGLAPAREGCMKLTEATRRQASVCAGGELRRGRLTAVSRGTAVVALATAVLPGLLEDLASARARGARIIAIASERDTEVHAYADEVIWLPVSDPGSANLAAAIPLQLLTQELAAGPTHSMRSRDGGDHPSSTSGGAAQAARVSRAPLLRPR